MEQAEECPLLDGKRQGIWIKKIVVAEMVKEGRKLFQVYIGEHIDVLGSSW